MRRESIYSKLHGVVEVLPVQPADIITDTAQIHAMDLTTMQPGDAYCRADFMLTARCQVSTMLHLCAAACALETCQLKVTGIPRFGSTCCELWGFQAPVPGHAECCSQGAGYKLHMLQVMYTLQHPIQA